MLIARLALEESGMRWTLRRRGSVNLIFSVRIFIICSLRLRRGARALIIASRRLVERPHTCSITKQEPLALCCASNLARRGNW